MSEKRFSTLLVHLHKRREDKLQKELQDQTHRRWEEEQSRLHEVQEREQHFGGISWKWYVCVRMCAEFYGVYACMYLRAYIRIDMSILCTYIHTYYLLVHTHLCVFTNLMQMYFLASLPLSLSIHMDTCVCEYVYVHKYTHIYMYIYIYRYACMCVHI